MSADQFTHKDGFGSGFFTLNAQLLAWLINEDIPEKI